jgi:hypothetical protein
LLRPRAAAIAKLVPEGEVIYAINPGPQQIFFYLRRPWEFIVDLSKLPPGAQYLLVPEKEIPELIRRFGTKTERLVSYKDRGEKESYLCRVNL